MTATEFPMYEVGGKRACRVAACSPALSVLLLPIPLPWTHLHLLGKHPTLANFSHFRKEIPLLHCYWYTRIQKWPQTVRHRYPQGISSEKKPNLLWIPISADNQIRSWPSEDFPDATWIWTPGKSSWGAIWRGEDKHPTLPLFIPNSTTPKWLFSTHVVFCECNETNMWMQQIYTQRLQPAEAYNLTLIKSTSIHAGKDNMPHPRFTFDSRGNPTGLHIYINKVSSSLHKSFIYASAKILITVLLFRCFTNSWLCFVLQIILILCHALWTLKLIS